MEISKYMDNTKISLEKYRIRIDMTECNARILRGQLEKLGMREVQNPNYLAKVLERGLEIVEQADFGTVIQIKEAKRK